MNTDNTTDLFEIRLSEEGISYIRKFANAAKFLVFIGALLSLLMLVTSAIRIFSDRFDTSKLEFWQALYFKTFPYFNLLHGILLPLQLFYYWKLKKLIKQGIDNKNEPTFNQSFKALFMNAVWGVITLSCSLFVGIFDTFIFIRYYF